MTTVNVPRLTQQGAVTLVLLAGGQGLMFLAHVLMGRAAGAGNYGLFAYVLAIVNICLIVGKAGQETVVLRYTPIYAQAGRSRDLRALILWGSAFATMGSLLVALTVAGVRHWYPLTGSESQAALTIGLIALPVLAVSAVRANVLMGLSRVLAAQVPDLLVRPLILIAVGAAALLAGRTLSATQCIAVFAAAGTGAFILGTVLLHSFVRSMPPQQDPSTVRPTEWLRAGLWLILVTGSYQAFSQIDVAIVGALRSKEEAGIYAAASRLSVLVQYGLIALQTIVAPRISAAYVARQMQDLQDLLSHLVRLATMFAVAVSLIMIALAVPILGLFGEKFTDGSTILRVLVLAHVANAMTGATGFLLTMTGHQRHVAAVVTVMLVVTTTALLLVVQSYGSVGAAWVMVASTAVTHIVLAWMGWRLLGLRSWADVSLRGMRRNP